MKRTVAPKAGPGPLPVTLNRSLKATATLVVTQLTNAGAESAVDASEWPYARISEQLDGRTCPLCAALNGLVVAVDSPEYRRYRDPSHIGCRRLMTRIHRDAAGAKVTFFEPDGELIKRHGHFHLRPDRYAEYRMPAQPAGRHFIVRRVRNLESGEISTRLDWAPWWNQTPEWKRTLVIQARAAQKREELSEILEKLGITDATDPVQLRQATLLGLRDRLEGWVTQASGPASGGGASGSAAAGASSTAAAVKPVPQGTPVSQALDVTEGETADHLREAAAAVDEVHGDGTLPEIPVVRIVSFETEGGFTHYGNGGPPVGITVNRLGDHQGFTLTHEIGHFLDYSGIGVNQQFASVSDAVMQEWRDAIEASAVVKRLRELEAIPSVTLPGGATLPVDPLDLEYLLSPTELWARSYSQYIATRSGNAVLIEQLAKLRGITDPVFSLGQWTDEEFEPIAAAIDKLFEALGWRK